MRSATQREYTTPALKPNTRYEVEVWAVTSIGKGKKETTFGTVADTVKSEIIVNFRKGNIYDILCHTMCYVCTVAIVFLLFGIDWDFSTPGPVVGLGFSVVSPSSVNVTWSEPTDPGSGIVCYNVTYGTLGMEETIGYTSNCSKCLFATLPDLGECIHHNYILQ